MGHTHNTPNFGLPQFIGTDKPSWLEDFNQAMQTIDTGLAQNRAASEGAEQSATQSNAIATSAKSLADSANTLSHQAVTDAGVAKGAQAWSAINVTANCDVKVNGFLSILRMHGNFPTTGVISGAAINQNIFGLDVTTDSNRTMLTDGVSAYWDGAQTRIYIEEAGDKYFAHVTAL